MILSVSDFERQLRSVSGESTPQHAPIPVDEEFHKHEQARRIHANVLEVMKLTAPRATPCQEIDRTALILTDNLLGRPPTVKFSEMPFFFQKKVLLLCAESRPLRHLLKSIGSLDCAGHPLPSREFWDG
jgi:hypothetical protein